MVIDLKVADIDWQKLWSELPEHQATTDPMNVDCLTTSICSSLEDDAGG